MGVIEHLPDYERVLKKFSRLLKPGGRVFLDGSAAKKKYELSTFMVRHIYPGNHSFLVLDDFLNKLAKTDFEVMEVHNDRWSYFLTFRQWARNLDANRDYVTRNFGDFEFRKFRLYLWGAAYEFLSRSLDCYRHDPLQAQGSRLRPGVLYRRLSKSVPQTLTRLSISRARLRSEGEKTMREHCEHCRLAQRPRGASAHDGRGAASAASALPIGRARAGGRTAAANPNAIPPAEALDLLMQGNARYAAGEPMRGTFPSGRAARAEAQYPIAAILGCADSRVSPELLFDQGPGDVFVVRLAGNFLDDDGFASLEYAVKFLGAPLSWSSATPIAARSTRRSRW